MNIGDSLAYQARPSSKLLSDNNYRIHSNSFKIDRGNPLLWQNGYNDLELSDLVAGKHAGVIYENGKPINSEDTQRIRRVFIQQRASQGRLLGQPRPDREHGEANLQS